MLKLILQYYYSELQPQLLKIETGYFKDPTGNSYFILVMSYYLLKFRVINVEGVPGLVYVGLINFVTKLYESNTNFIDTKLHESKIYF